MEKIKLGNTVILNKLKKTKTDRLLLITQLNVPMFIFLPISHSGIIYPTGVYLTTVA